MMRSYRWHPASGPILIVLVCICGISRAGPPLSIDDPGVLDPGKFEIIFAAAAEGRGSGNEYLFPVLDVSYGVSPDVQLAVVATRIVSRPEEGGSKSDFGPAAISAKWRFLNRGSLQMSVAPYFEALPREGAAERGIVDDIEAWVIPVEWQYGYSTWRFNAEIGYAAAHDAADEWSYGLAAAYPLSEFVEVLFEIHGGADRRLNENGLLYRVGIDLAASESFHLLAAAGSSIDEPGDDDLDFQVYLGLQWFP